MDKLSDQQILEIYKKTQDEGMSVAGLTSVRFARAIIEAHKQKELEFKMHLSAILPHIS